MSQTAATQSDSHLQRQVHVVLPAYNEAGNIKTLLDQIAAAMREANLSYQVILVDDGSHDDTAVIAEACRGQTPLRIIQHAVNLGLGRTIRDGLMAAAETAAEQDVIVTMDADGTHPPEPIQEMVQKIGEGYDVVIASRYQRGSRTVGVPFSRRCLSRCASWLLRILFPTPGVRDFTCGYRAYRAQAIRNAIQHYGNDFAPRAGFECMMDILLALKRMKVRFAEAPFTLRYDLKKGGTKMKVGLTAFKSLTLIIRKRLGS